MTFDEFVTARLAAFVRYALMLTGDQHLAEDLVQETMVRAKLKWSKVSRADAPEHYVKRMMINLYVDWRRGSWFKRVFLTGDAKDNRWVPDDHVQKSVDRDWIWTALSGLPRQQRAALVLRFYEDLPDQQIADVLGCSVGAARGYISKALTRLRSLELVPGGAR